MMTAATVRIGRPNTASSKVGKDLGKHAPGIEAATVYLFYRLG